MPLQIRRFWPLLFVWLAACSSQPTKPLDLQAIESLDQAVAYHEKGVLKRVYLFPLRFGGHDGASNVVYLPEGAANQKAQIDAEVIAATQRGEIDKYTALPKFKGKSVIPSEIIIKATGSGMIQKTIQVY